MLAELGLEDLRASCDAVPRFGLSCWWPFPDYGLRHVAIACQKIICLSDLQDDYLNPFESSSRINAVVVPEMVLQGALCILFLLTGHWLMFIVTLPNTFYNAMLFMKGQHLIDVTEVFRFLKAEKKYRLIKLGFYLILFVIVLIRTFAGAFSTMSDFHSNSEELDIRASFLEF